LIAASALALDLLKKFNSVKVNDNNQRRLAVPRADDSSASSRQARKFGPLGDLERWKLSRPLAHTERY